MRLGANGKSASNAKNYPQIIGRKGDKKALLILLSN
jgi:hypothetical protein